MDTKGYTSLEQQARELGQERGEGAGSWVVDGNTPASALRLIISKSEEGELFDMINPPAPLSGEFADDWTPRTLAEALEIDDERDDFDDLCTAFEDAYWLAFEDEAVRSARAMLPEEES